MMVKIFIIVIMCIKALCGIGFENNVMNAKVKRSINLNSQLVRIFANITIKNLENNPLQDYIILLEPDILGNLSYIAVENTRGRSLDVVQKDSGKFIIKLKPFVKAGEFFKFSVQTLFSKALIPCPSTITQHERQFVKYFGNHYFYSPYFSKKQTTNLTFTPTNIENYTILDPTLKLPTSPIIYGPYINVPPYFKSKMTIHYENNAPFLTIRRLKRIIEVSHWGRIGIIEHFELQHTGTKLRGAYMRNFTSPEKTIPKEPSSIKSYWTILPPTAYDISYKDINGNIFSKFVKYNRDYVLLKLGLRFPLFGGWKSSHTLSYKIFSYPYLHKTSNNEYVLNIRILDHIFDDMYVEELETYVVLPVGAKNVMVLPPYDVVRLPDGLSYSYLDYIGRIVIKLSRGNLVEEHIQEMTISYKWDPIMFFYEPLLLITALYFIFIVLIVFLRLDFTIQHKKIL